MVATGKRTVSFQQIFVDGSRDGCVPVKELMADDGSRSLWGKEQFDPRDQTLFIPYSSGTTGLPKGVMVTHHSMVVQLTLVK